MNALSGLEAAVMRAGGSLVAPSGRRGSLIVLMFHRVLAAADPLLADEPDAQTFASQMDLIAQVCNVLPLKEAVERLADGTLPARAACITFDDGYANNFTIAAPILKARKLPATIFVSSGFIAPGRMWNDTVIESVRRASNELDLTAIGLGRHLLGDLDARRFAIDSILNMLKYRELDDRRKKAAEMADRVGHALPTDLMMTEGQLRGLASFDIEVGAHTVSHPILTRVSGATAQREIADSRSTLEAITSRRVNMFAYPNGRPGQDYDRSHVEMVRAAGFDAAVSTAWGAARRDADRFQIPRIRPWDRSALRFSARLLRTFVQRRAEQV